MRTHGHRKGSTKHWGLLGGKGEGQRWGELGRDSLGKNDIFKNIFLMFLSKNLKMKSIESIQNSLLVRSRLWSKWNRMFKNLKTRFKVVK